MFRFGVLLALLFIILSTTVTAHPGRTDQYGGHNDQTTGEYHMHISESAGQEQSDDAIIIPLIAGVGFVVLIIVLLICKFIKTKKGSNMVSGLLISLGIFVLSALLDLIPFFLNVLAINLDIVYFTFVGAIMYVMASINNISRGRFIMAVGGVIAIIAAFALYDGYYLYAISFELCAMSLYVSGIEFIICVFKLFAKLLKEKEADTVKENTGPSCTRCGHSLINNSCPVCAPLFTSASVGCEARKKLESKEVRTFCTVDLIIKNMYQETGRIDYSKLPYGFSLENHFAIKKKYNIDDSVIHEFEVYVDSCMDGEDMQQHIDNYDSTYFLK